MAWGTFVRIIILLWFKENTFYNFKNKRGQLLTVVLSMAPASSGSFPQKPSFGRPVA